MAITKKELREKELIKHFRHDDEWLGEIPSRNKWVNNDTIKLNQIGADPEVLINNNTYPIPTNGREDGETVISLNKLETENTDVTDDELYAIPYDKLGSVQTQHREKLQEYALEYSLHSLAPYENTVDIPVIQTTGADDGNGRKRMRLQDVSSLQKRFNDLKIPKRNRILILSSTHSQDLMDADTSYNNRMMNHAEGMPPPMLYGFKVYVANGYSPLYDETSKQKKPYNAIIGESEVVLEGSVAIYTRRAAQARGSVMAYMRHAKDDPENRKTVLGFRLYHIALNLTNKGQGAIIDGRV